MSHLRFLIDTNVFIGLEDDKEINPNFSSLVQLAASHEAKIFVHEAAKDDINRDKNSKRRQISLSKFKKFPALSKVRGLSEKDLSIQFGELRKHNDIVDATLLHALSLDVADFLVTEDRKLHERARKRSPKLSGRLLYVADSVSLLRSRYEPINLPIRYIEEIEAHSIPLNDPIFESLREDYEKFDEWWKTKCVENLRRCWIVSDRGIAGILVRKDEDSDDTDASLSGNKILKICTFKVRPENRGLKLGELLLKQVIWFAQSNSYDVIYVTTYSKQDALIDLLEYYGFINTYEKPDGEHVYEKAVCTQKLELIKDQNPFDAHRINYPRFSTETHVKAYGIPIKEDYHDELFPDLKEEDPQPNLFEALGIFNGPKRPGNTIRKVYLSRAQANLNDQGSLLFFYKGKSKSLPSQSITAIGVLESMELAYSTKELMQKTSGRSVYSEGQLDAWKASNDRPVKVINFSLASYISPPLDLNFLKATTVFKDHPNQSIFEIHREKLLRMLPELQIGFEV